MNAWARLKQSRNFWLVLKIALTLAAFDYVLNGIDFQHVKEILATQKNDGIAAACVLIMIQICLGSMRWRMVLVMLSCSSGYVIRPLEAFKLYYISVFFNCCLPGTVGGDVVRVWLAKSDHVPLQTSIHSVIIDRVIALIALGVLALAGLTMLGQAVGFSPYLLWVLVVLAVVGMWFIWQAPKLLSPYEHIRPVRWLLHFLECVRILFRHPFTTMASLAIGILSHVCFSVAGYMLAQSMGMELSLMQSIALIPLVMLITTLPISIGGWGVREASMVAMLGLVGIPQAQALTLSVEYGLMNIILSLPAALLWVVYRRRSSDLQNAKKTNGA